MLWLTAKYNEVIQLNAHSWEVSMLLQMPIQQTADLGDIIMSRKKIPLSL